MDEQVINDLFERAVSSGYKKGRQDFIKLLYSDKEVFDDNFQYVQSQGYQKSPADFELLIGKKKVGTVSALADGSLALPKTERAVAESTAMKPRMIAPIKEEEKKKAGEQGYIFNTVSGLNRGFYENLIGNPIKGLGTLLEQGTAKITGGSGKAFISDALINFGDYFNNAIKELNPQDEEFKGTLTDQFANAFGQVASVVLTAGAGAAGKGVQGAAALTKAAVPAAAAKGAAAATGIKGVAQTVATKAAPAIAAGKTLATEMASPAAISAGLSMGQSEFDRAKAAGATDDQAFEAFYKSAAVGSILEKIPVMQFMNRFNKASAGGIVNYIKTKGVAGLTGGIEEMTTEVLQQLYANKNAQDIYNVNQELFEGVGESGGVGFGVGFLLNAMGANAKLLRKEGKDAEAKVVEDQVKQLEVQAQRGGPSSYSFNGIKIQPIETEEGIEEPRKVIENMINNMSAADLSKANIEITNDPELKIKLQDKIVTSAVKEQVRQGNPELNEASLNAITDLELQLRKLEGNTTQTGKDKAAAIRAQIKDIQENQLQEEVKSERFIKEGDKFYEVVADGRQMTTTEITEDAYNAGILLEKETLKTQQDAIQKQAAGQVPVQPTTGSSQEMAQGKPQAGPQVVTAKGEEAITPEGTKEISGGVESEWMFKNGEREINVSDIEDTRDGGDMSLKEAIDRVNEGQESKTEGFPSVARSESGKFKIADGYHRIAKSIIEGKNKILANVENSIAIRDALYDGKYQKAIEDGLMTAKEAKDIIESADFNGVKLEVPKEILKAASEPTATLKTQPKVTQVKVAPFFNTTIANKEEAATLRQSPEYKNYIQSLNDIAKQIGISAKVVETIGGYENQKGERIVEISNSVDLENATIEQAEEFAALAAALAPEVQEASIAAQYTEQGSKNHNANEYSVVVSDVDAAIEALKKVGITDFSIDEKTGEVSFIDVLDFTDPELQQNIGNFLFELNEKGIKYEQQVYKPLDSRRIGKGARKKVLGRIKSAGPRPVEGGQDVLQTLEEAIKRDAEFQGVEAAKYFEPSAGNRLFNEPISGVSEIANRYFQRIFGTQRPKYFGSKSLDEARAKRISDAFDAMKNDPNNPEVKEAYEALAKETLEQYKDMADAGYSIEINNNEPYNNSQEMIDDLRKNKRMKIFSTESGFGDSKITDEQRAQNPLLRDSGIKDVNGKPLLVNDVFRAIHDFFGHSELGNSFGKKGEENAWNIHARMYSPIARKAMTTETRGQNSYVNFSGVNDKVNELREQARELREEGLFAQARKKVEEIYEEMSFADQKVGLLPEEFYQIDENDMGDADRIPEAEVMEEISQELNEADLPGYDRMMSEIEGVIKKSENRGVPFNKIMDNVMEYMKKSKAYENATDVQREALVRDIRSRFKKKEKRAPSVKKVLGQKKTEVTVDDYKMMVNQIKMEARAAREAKADLNTKRKQLADVVRKMATEGKISVNRVAALINKIGKLNLDSQTAVDKFIDYAGKLFADAEYANKLNTANTTRKQLRSLSKNKDKAANLRDLAKQFSEIDPSMVEDIDEYNRVASLIKESIKGSTTRGADTKFANMVKESDAMKYINKTMEEQKKKMFDMKVAEVQELLGVDASELTYEQLVEMIDKKGAVTKDNEKLIRSAINKAFDLYSTIIKESIRTGKDPFTGEDIEYTANQKRVVKEFMSMDLNLLKPKQAIEAVDALMNFFQNQSVAKMGSVFAKYMGEYEMNRMNKKGVKGKPISKYWSKGLGRLLVEQTANINILFEREFGGFNAGNDMMDAMGLTDAIVGKSSAQTESNKAVEQYVDKFYKTKPNGQEFNTALNDIERNMAAFMMRNVIGTEPEMKAEFQRRKDLVSESIAELEKGNEQEVEKSKLYQKVFDKIGADSNTIEDVQSKVDKTNMEAIKFWQDKFSDKYDELSDVALGVYNKVLGKEINYTPDFYKKLSSDTGKVELANDDMAFLFNSGNAPLYKKETGVLMAATRPETLPTDDNGTVNRYLDFSDNNIANAYYDALVDIKTAAPIRQMDAALNSDSFKKIVSNADDRRLIENRIKLFVNNTRKKNPFSNDEFSKAVKSLNRLTNIAVGQALGGLTQPIKQTIPIALNTLINAGDFDLASITDKSKQDFMNNSGYAISNRGAESQAQIESLNKLIEESAKSKGEKLLRGVETLNKAWLKYTLVKFDLAVARASWMTYYEQSLQKQGIDPNGIDYTTHELNKEAADYAQRQVDRQQNVSDTDLAGALLSSKDASKQIAVKIIMPFASFRMNQSARIGSDIATLTNKMATVEDKKTALRSLTGSAVETAAFRALSIGIALTIAKVVKGVMGRDDDEEKDQKKKDAIIKGQLTGTVADVLSPTPILDKIVQLGVSNILETTQDALDIPKDDRVAIYSGNQQDIFQQLGLLGITGARAYQIIEMVKLSSGGSFEDDYGRKKYLSEADRDAIGGLIPIAILSNIGLAPAELNSVVRSSLSDAKRSASTVEGGKSREDVMIEERAEEVSGDRKERREEAKSDKLNALKELRDDEVDADKIKAIDDMIEMLSMTDEEKKAVKSDLAAEKVEKEEEMKKLLGGYDNKTDLKRYDPELYEQNFGENSEYYLKNQAEMEVEKELNKKLQELEDEKMGYTPSQKRRSQFRERIKSSKSRYRRESESIR